MVILISGNSLISYFIITIMSYICSPTGPGFVSMSPLSNSSNTTTITTFFRHEGTLRHRPDDIGHMLEWEKERDKHMFDLTTLFWRTMAGSRLLRDDSTRGVWLKTK